MRMELDHEIKNNICPRPAVAGRRGLGFAAGNLFLGLCKPRAKQQLLARRLDLFRPPPGLAIGQYGTGNYHSATRSLRFSGQNGQFQVISQPLYFVAGEKLTFSCWVINTGNGTVDTQMQWGTSPTGPWTIFHDPNNFNGVAPWTLNEGTFTPTTSGTYYIRFFLNINGQGLGYIDDIKLTYNEGAVLNVNSTGYQQPGTQIFKNGVSTGFYTNHSFPATPVNVAGLAGTYTPGAPPAGYHWVNPSITVSTTDFTVANGYVHTITFVLEKDFTLIVNSSPYITPGTEIFRNGTSTSQYTNHTFTSTTASALAGTYTPGPAPAGYYWQTTSIPVLESGFTEANAYTQTITFYLAKYYELRVLSIGTGQPGTAIFRNDSPTNQVTDYTFYSTDPATLAGSYTPGPAPAGYHWVTTPITVATTDFTAGNNYIHTITFVLEEDPLPVELSSFTATISIDNHVNLLWVTQSETGVQGFYILRNSSADLATALTVSDLIQATNSSQQQSYLFTDAEIWEDGTYYYWLQNSDLDGTVAFHGPISIVYTAAEGNIPVIPLVTELKACYPNPFNPLAYFPYSLKESATVNFEIYNSRGQLMRRIPIGDQAAGHHQIEWNGRDNQGRPCGTGVYHIRMTAGTESFFRKAVLLK